jgi:hypothetical protein
MPWWVAWRGRFVSWDQRFFDPIIVAGRKPLVTLRDAAHYVMKLPKAEQQATPWQTAAEVLSELNDGFSDACRPYATILAAIQNQMRTFEKQEFE